jgi:hypothetical protein
LSLAEGTPWIEARLAQPGWLCEFRLEAVPHPYPVKRRHRNAVEIHCLYGEHAGRIRMLHEFRLATPGDRDLALRFPEPPGPFSILRLATVKAPPVAIGWRNLRVYGRLAAK